MPDQQLRLITEAPLPEMGSKKTGLCLRAERYGLRDSKLNKRLPKVQLEQQAGLISSYELLEGYLTFRGLFTTILAVPNDIPIPELAAHLEDRQHLFTLPALEYLVERTDAFEEFGLRTDNKANLVPVRNHGSGVSIIQLRCFENKWSWKLNDLARISHWGEGVRVLLFTPNERRR